MKSTLGVSETDVSGHQHAGAANDKRALLEPLPVAPVETGPRWRFDKPVLLALSLASGSAVYFNLGFEPNWALVAGLLTLALALFLILRRFWQVPALGLLALVLLGLAGGGALAKLRTGMVDGPRVTEPMPPALIEGWVSSIDRGGSGLRLTLYVHAISGLAPEATPRRIRLTHTNTLMVAPGRFVRCYGVLRPAPAPSMAGDYDFQMQSWFSGLGGVGYVQGRCRGGALGAPSGMLSGVQMEVSALRRQFASYVNEAAGPRAGGFAAALMSGDRSFMSQADSDALRGSGLAHLLAISGLHMGIVGGLVYLIMRRGLALIEPVALRVPVQKPAAATALMASLVYLIISGASVSTQRAFIMAAIFFGAILFDRAALSMRSFALALMAVVAIHPESVMTPGFQMSFAATGALIASYEAWTERRRARPERRGGAIGFSLKSLVLTSVVGSLATAPYAVYHFGRVATHSLTSNLLAMPIISFLSAPLAAAALVAAPFGLSEPVIGLFGKTLEWVLAIAHALDEDGGGVGANLPDMSAGSLVAFTMALAALVAIRGWVRWPVCLVFCLAGAVLWSRSPQPALHWAPSGDVFIIKASGEEIRVTYADGEGLGPLRFAGLGVSQDCSERPCQFDTRAGPVTLHQADPRQLSCGDLGEGLHLFRRGEETYCPGSILWADVAALGGQTVRKRPGGGLLMERSAPCRPRPWAPCRQS